MIPVIKETREYDLFKFVGKNRGVDPQKVSLFKKTMKESPHLPALNPILVNESMEIIDGQHRFHACRDLGIPIYYLQSAELTHEDIITLNKDRKNWTLDDFINFHVRNGNKNFISLVAFSKESGLTISMSCLFLGFNRKSLVAQIKDGSLIFPTAHRAEAAIQKSRALGAFTAKAGLSSLEVARRLRSYSFGEAVAALPDDTDIEKFFSALEAHIEDFCEHRGWKDYHLMFKNWGAL